MPVLLAERVSEVLLQGGSARLAAERAPLYHPGDTVRVHNGLPSDHTRVPRYARDKCGVIAADHGVFILPDRHARDGVKQPDRLYSVRFEGGALWGDDVGGRDAVYVDLFESYLDAAA